MRKSLFTEAQVIGILKQDSRWPNCVASWESRSRRSIAGDGSLEGWRSLMLRSCDLPQRWTSRKPASLCGTARRRTTPNRRL